MDIKKRKVELPNKDTMLFISNSIFNLHFSSNMPKRKIYEKMMDYYKKSDNLFTLIEVLSFDAYNKLERICTDVNNGINPEKSFKENYTEELEDIMVFILEEYKYNDDSFDCFYTSDLELFKKLSILFNNEGKEKANKEYTFERVIKGLFNIYGIIKKEYFVSFVNSYLKTNYTYSELMDKVYSKLILNTLVETFSINWTNLGERDSFVSKIPYEDNLGIVAESQKQIEFDYNIHEIDYIIEKANINYEKEYNDLFMFLDKYNIEKEKIIKFIDEAILGIKEASEILKIILENIPSSDIDDVLDFLTMWHNNLCMYPLCGYSPSSLSDTKMVS